ncbi:hypothetical protein KC344_g98 [Hortaea werneckii]|nr:hypothetical protein KC344_g98 [Hortaea werneckii]
MRLLDPDSPGKILLQPSSRSMSLRSAPVSDSCLLTCYAYFKKTKNLLQNTSFDRTRQLLLTCFRCHDFSSNLRMHCVLRREAGRRQTDHHRRRRLHRMLH